MAHPESAQLLNGSDSECAFFIFNIIIFPQDCIQREHCLLCCESAQKQTGDPIISVQAQQRQIHLKCFSTLGAL